MGLAEKEMNDGQNMHDDRSLRLVISFSLTTPTPRHPDKPPCRPTPRGLDFGPFRLRLALFRVRLAPFRLRFGVLGGVLDGVGAGSGSGRGASVREKNITTLGFKTQGLCWGVWSTWKSEVKLSPPRGRPLKTSMDYGVIPFLYEFTTEVLGSVQ